MPSFVKELFPPGVERFRAEPDGARSEPQMRNLPPADQGAEGKLTDLKVAGHLARCQERRLRSADSRRRLQLRRNFSRLIWLDLAQGPHLRLGGCESRGEDTRCGRQGAKQAAHRGTGGGVMRTVDLSSEPLSAAELLDLARTDPLLVKTARGDSFMVSPADEFARGRASATQPRFSCDAR